MATERDPDLDHSADELLEMARTIVSLERTALIFEEKHGTDDSVCMLARGLAGYISEIYNGQTLVEQRKQIQAQLHAEAALLQDSKMQFAKSLAGGA